MITVDCVQSPGQGGERAGAGAARRGGEGEGGSKGM